jgi:hypothetical protein
VPIPRTASRDHDQLSTLIIVFFNTIFQTLKGKRTIDHTLIKWDTVPCISSPLRISLTPSKRG